MPKSRLCCAAAPLVPLLAALATTACHSTPGAAPDPGLTPATEGALYHFGYALGETVSLQQLDDSEIDELVAGLRDRAQGLPPRYGNPDEYQGEIGHFLAQRRLEIGERRFEEERSLLVAAAREPGSHTTEGGAVVVVLEPGEGAAPESGARVRMHYSGVLLDGSPVRSTAEERPYELVFDRANICWREALAGYGAAGARLRVTCPPQLLFGMKGKAGWAPPGAVVVWDLELLEVVDGS